MLAGTMDKRTSGRPTTLLLYCCFFSFFLISASDSRHKQNDLSGNSRLAMRENGIVELLHTFYKLGARSKAFSTSSHVPVILVARNKDCALSLKSV